MAKYVEIEKVQEMLENAQIVSDGVNCGYCTDDISLEKILLADAVFVGRAKWVKIVEARLDTTGFCSACGKQSVWRAMDMPYPICPFCGKKMDL